MKTKREAGGPAFPFVYTTGDGFKETSHVHDGMTLRDYLAGQALAGRAGTFTHPKDAARHAYTVADAMLEERAK